MICGVTNLGFIGGDGYTYMHTPACTLISHNDYNLWDEMNSDPRDYLKRVKAFNIARGLLIKELETIMLNKIGINTISPVKEILSALENGNATIYHDPCYIEYLEIDTPGQVYMFIDLASDGQTIIDKYYPLLGWLSGAAGTGGACYHNTHPTNKNKKLERISQRIVLCRSGYFEVDYRMYWRGL
ncbi:MAG: hypothetical protein QFX38_07420 [Methanothermobacter sp.]|nr:hypothetical protein [Methanothermobacter sp.]